MPDVLTPSQRRMCMSRIRSKNTKPELVVRRLLHGLGFRYRLHDKSLPGCPDIVLKKHKKIVFVHGCFWHRHNCKYGRIVPQTRRDFWESKLDGNKLRDSKTRRKLRQLGWKIFVVWECQIKDADRLTDRLLRFLNKQ